MENTEINAKIKPKQTNKIKQLNHAKCPMSLTRMPNVGIIRKQIMQHVQLMSELPP